MESRQRFTLDDIFKGERLRSLIAALMLLSGAYVLEHYANLYELEYSLRPTTTHVGDILLDNLPVIDVNLIVIQGALLAIVGSVLFIIFFRPRYLLFTLKAVALFIAIRAFFISLTHMGIYPGHVYPEPGLFSAVYTYLNLQTGFFFSGHTGMPFLMALIFWKEYRVRIVFLAMAFLFAVGVLLAHSHYSIDVFAAPFMAYGILEIARYFFPRDYALIDPVQKKEGV